MNVARMPGPAPQVRATSTTARIGRASGKRNVGNAWRSAAAAMTAITWISADAR